MAFRKNLYDFGAIEGDAGGANAAANDAAFALALAHDCRNIEIEHGTFEVSATVDGFTNAKRLIGVDGCDGFGTISAGTRLKWCGAPGGTMMRVAPGGNKDLIAAGVSGIQLDGNGIAGRGLVAQATRRAHLADLQATRLAENAIGFYFAGKPEGHDDVGSNLLGDFRNLSANAGLSGIPMLVDGMSGSTLTNTVLTHKNGVALYLRSCDTVRFNNTSMSRHEGHTGISLLFDGIQTYVYGITFYGLHCGAWPIGAPVTIWSRGSKARCNLIDGIDGLDNQPSFVIEQGSNLYYRYIGGGYTPTLAAETALERAPKQQILNY